MFSKFAQRCVFPHAVKPWQKALCMTTGVGVTGLGFYGTGKLVMYSVSHISKKNPENDEPIGNFLDIEETPTEKNRKRYSDRTVFSQNLLSTGVCLFGTGFFSSFTYIFGNETLKYHKNYWRLLKGTKDCCNIIRSTGSFVVVSPLCLFGTTMVFLYTIEAAKLTYKNGKELLK